MKASAFSSSDVQHESEEQNNEGSITRNIRGRAAARPPLRTLTTMGSLFAPLERAATISHPYYFRNIEQYEYKRDKASKYYHDLGRAHSVQQLGKPQDEFEAWWFAARKRTTIVVNLANVLERMDEQVLPAVYKFIGASYKASLSELGYLTLCRAVFQASAAPLGGIAGHKFNRLAVIMAGCFVWGCGITSLGLTRTLHQGMAVVALDGIGLSLLIPNAQSITADYFDELDRGKAFGLLFLTGAVGGSLGAIYATNVAAFTPWGIEGWRLVFFSIGVASFLVGIVAYKMGHDPRYDQDKEPKNLDHTAESAGELWQEVKQILLTPTFLIIILQGVVGSMPWNSLVFLTMYFQLLGLSNFTASLLMSLFLLSTAFGGLLGGSVGDFMARRFPNHGRIAATQFSIVMGVPLSIVLLKVLPHTATTMSAILHAATLVTMGVMITWAAPCCNNPVFAEIVPPNLRNLVYSFDRSFEMGIAALGAPLVGLMAEHWFGYSGATSEGEGPGGADLQNAEALGNALVVSMVVPWFLCFVFYSLMHITYPRDKEYALAQLQDDDESDDVQEQGYRALPQGPPRGSAESDAMLIPASKAPRLGAVRFAEE